MRQEPRDVLLPTSGEVCSEALDRDKPAGKPQGTEKRAAMKSREKKTKKIGPAENGRDM